MKQVYAFGVGQGITPRASILISIAGPRGGSAAAFGMDADQADELANNLRKAAKEARVSESGRD